MAGRAGRGSETGMTLGSQRTQPEQGSPDDREGQARREALARRDQAAVSHPRASCRAVEIMAGLHGLDLDSMPGTGPTGTITVTDVMAAKAQARDGERLRQMAAAAPAAPRDPAYARNPLVDEVLRQYPQFATRGKVADRPTLFLSGDLPPFTASGIDPTILLNVPWQARNAVAAAPTMPEAYRLLTNYTADPEAAYYDLGGDHRNVAYADRVSDWRMSLLTDDELWEEIQQQRQGRKLAVTGAGSIVRLVPTADGGVVLQAEE